MKNFIGVLGGMGPAATVDFMQKVIELTHAGNDQQHIPLLVSSMPDIPDRTACLLHGGASPLPALLERLQMLEKAGAACIVIPCNTAHYWFAQLQAAASVEMLNLIDLVTAAAREAGFSKVGLLATNATLATGLYQKALEKIGIACIAPEGDLQQSVMNGVYALKAGDLAQAHDLLAAPYQYLRQQKVEAVVLGCTEIPLIFADEVRTHPARFLDSTQILARAVVGWYKNSIFVP